VEPERIPHHAYHFQNGMLMVFDKDGQEVPEYQGHAVDEIPRLIEDYPMCDIIPTEWSAWSEQ
jgi:hypothetical protein